jgi:GTPase involved in cell partitioning and DNA repair
VGELGKFNEELLAKPRWLVLNKSDLLPPEEAVAKAVSIAVALKYRGPAFLISGATHAGTRDLTEAVMRFLETGEAPARGNLELPAIVEKPKTVKAAKPARKAARKKTSTMKAVPKKKLPAKKKAPARAKRLVTKFVKKPVKKPAKKRTRR